MTLNINKHILLLPFREVISLNEVTKLTLVIYHSLRSRWGVHHLLQVVVLKINQQLIRIETNPLTTDARFNFANLVCFVISLRNRNMIRACRRRIYSYKVLFPNYRPRSHRYATTTAA